LNLDPMRS